MFQRPLSFSRAAQSQQSRLSLFKSLVARGRVQASLRIIAEKAAKSVAAPMCAIVASVGARHEILAGWRVGFSTLHFDWDRQAAGCDWRSDFVIWGAAAHPYMANHKLFLEAPFVRTIFNIAVDCDDPAISVSIVVISDKPLTPFEGESLHAINSIHRQMSELAFAEMDTALSILSAAGKDWEGPSVESLGAVVDNLDVPAALLDLDLRVLAVNPRLQQLSGELPAQYEGMPVERLDVAGKEAIALACLAASRSDSSNGPFVAISPLEMAARHGLAIARCHPIMIGHGFRPLNLVTLDTVGEQFGKNFQESATQISLHDGTGPIESFLTNTLSVKTNVRSRNDVTYMTARAWRKSIKEHQIAALRALKSAPSDTFADAIATELLNLLERLSGASHIDVVVPIPPGSSGMRESLSIKIAQAIARHLNVPTLRALDLDTGQGTSHPKRNLRRSRMRLTQSVADKNVLIVDDVATSGHHIEEASSLLRREARSTFAIAWIGGEAQ